MLYYLVLALIILAVPALLVVAGRSSNTAPLVRATVGSILALLLLGAIDQLRTGTTAMAWTWVLFALMLPIFVALIVRLTAKSGLPRLAQWALSFVAGLAVLVVVSLVAARAAGPPPP